MTLLSMTVPLLFLTVSLYATARKIDLYAALLKGAKEGLQVILNILPALITLLTAIAMLRASGALDFLATLLSPLLHLIGIPPELLPLMLIRPFSGSGALAVASDLLQTHGPDSQIGRIASVMIGSTETTFYVIALYFSTITKTRYAIPAALLADLTGFLTATWIVNLLFYS